jgi:hypothetical protein
VNLTLLNNTYIVASPYTTLASSAINLTYFTIPDLYNYTYLQALGYMYTATSQNTSDETSTFYYIIGSVIGGLILMTLTIYLVC